MSKENIVCKRCDTTNQYRLEKAGPHLKAICNNCNNYIKFVGQDGEIVMPFGKYKGSVLSKMRSEEEIRYLQWLSANMNTSLGVKIKDHLKSIGR
jgi:uncharacterized protein (DUF3820 family)